MHALCESLRELMPTFVTGVMESCAGVIFLGRKGTKHPLLDAPQTGHSRLRDAHWITTVERTHASKKEHSCLFSFREALWVQSKGTDKPKPPSLLPDQGRMVLDLSSLQPGPDRDSWEYPPSCLGTPYLRKLLPPMSQWKTSHLLKKQLKPWD